MASTFPSFTTTTLPSWQSGPGYRPMSAASRPSSATSRGPSTPRRPASSSIAATPLEKLPPGCVKKAESLLVQGKDEIEVWLSSGYAQSALWRQGLKVHDVLTASSITEKACSAAETRYARQLLGQLVWEAELCEAADVVQAQDCDLNASGNQLMATGLSTQASTAPDTARPRSRSCSPPKKLNQKLSPSNLCREEVGSSLIQQETLLKRCLQKEQFLAGVKERARQRNRRIKERQTAAFEARQQKERMRMEEAEKSAQRGEEKLARVKCEKREIAELMCLASAVRQAVLETNRRRMIKEKEDRLTATTLKAEQNILEAEARRQQKLRERSAGPPELRAVRELSRRQALRIEKIREAEREVLREKIEQKDRAKSPGETPPSSPTRLRSSSRPTSARTIALAIAPPSEDPPSVRRPLQQRAVVRPQRPASAAGNYGGSSSSRASVSRQTRRSSPGLLSSDSQIKDCSTKATVLVEGVHVPEPTAVPWPTVAATTALVDKKVVDWRNGNAKRTKISSHRNSASKLADLHTTSKEVAARPRSAPACSRREVLDPLGIFPLAGVRQVSNPDCLAGEAFAASDAFADLLRWSNNSCLHRQDFSETYEAIIDNFSTTIAMPDDVQKAVLSLPHKDAMPGEGPSEQQQSSDQVAKDPCDYKVAELEVLDTVAHDQTLEVGVALLHAKSEPDSAMEKMPAEAECKSRATSQSMDLLELLAQNIFERVQSQEQEQGTVTCTQASLEVQERPTSPANVVTKTSTWRDLEQDSSTAYLDGNTFNIQTQRQQSIACTVEKLAEEVLGFSEEKQVCHEKHILPSSTKDSSTEPLRAVSTSHSDAILTSNSEGMLLQAEKEFASHQAHGAVPHKESNDVRENGATGDAVIDRASAEVVLLEFPLEEQGENMQQELSAIPSFESSIILGDRANVDLVSQEDSARTLGDELSLAKTAFVQNTPDLKDTLLLQTVDAGLREGFLLTSTETNEKPKETFEFSSHQLEVPTSSELHVKPVDTNLAIHTEKTEAITRNAGNATSTGLTSAEAGIYTTKEVLVFPDEKQQCHEQGLLPTETKHISIDPLRSVSQLQVEVVLTNNSEGMLLETEEGLASNQADGAIHQTERKEVCKSRATEEAVLDQASAEVLCVEFLPVQEATDNKQPGLPTIRSLEFSKMFCSPSNVDIVLEEHTVVAGNDVFPLTKDDSVQNRPDTSDELTLQTLVYGLTEGPASIGTPIHDCTVNEKPTDSGVERSMCEVHPSVQEQHADISAASGADTVLDTTSQTESLLSAELQEDPATLGPVDQNASVLEHIETQTPEICVHPAESQEAGPLIVAAQMQTELDRDVGSSTASRINTSSTGESTAVAKLEALAGMDTVLYGREDARFAHLLTVPGAIISPSAPETEVHHSEAASEVGFVVTAVNLAVASATAILEELDLKPASSVQASSDEVQQQILHFSEADLLGESAEKSDAVEVTISRLEPKPPASAPPERSKSSSSGSMASTLRWARAAAYEAARRFRPKERPSEGDDNHSKM